MWTKAIAWLFGTSMGRGVLLGSSLMIGAGLSWWLFADHYYEKGKTACELGRAVDTNEANVAQGEQNAANNAASSEVGKQADAEAAALAEEAERAKQETKETVDEIYRKPPATAPVAVDSCMHPVDDRVQDRIDAARAAAVEARAPAR